MMQPEIRYYLSVLDLISKEKKEIFINTFKTNVTLLFDQMLTFSKNLV